MNCIDNECKYLLHTWDYEMYCSLTHEEVPDDIDIFQCENFVQAKTCLDCSFSKMKIYEEGYINEIDYYCPLQKCKLIYKDLDPNNEHYGDVPECGIGRFKHRYEWIK